MNNLKFIILDYLAAKKSGVLDWRRDLCGWCDYKQSVYLEGNALQTSYRVQYTQGWCSCALHRHTQHWSIGWNCGAAACLVCYVQCDMLCLYMTQ